jgi:hypothetical protein
MYLLYLDDSGSPANKNEKYFVLGGFIVHEKNLFWINQRLDELAKKYQENLTTVIEFHASAISGGRDMPWNNIKNKAIRFDILKDMLSIAADTRNDLRILACAVEKNSSPKLDPVERSFEDLCSRFNIFLKRKHAENNEMTNGLIILDESSYETTLQGLSKNFRTLGNKWGITTNNIQEVPLFVNSKASRGIQLADHIAYSVFRRYEHDDLSYFNIIEGNLDADNEKIHGLCHITSNQTCTCPYCIQRKFFLK